MLIPLFFFAVSLGFVFFFSFVSGGGRRGLLLRAFLYGVISGPVAGVISQVFLEIFLRDVPSFYWPDFWLYFFIVGPVEEAFKFVAFFLVVRREQSITRSGYLLAAIAVALGFAGGENVLYAMSYGFELTWPRLLLGNLGHAGYAVLWGYAYSLVVIDGAAMFLLVVGYIAAALLHGAYDYFLGFSYVGASFSFFITLMLFRVMIKLLAQQKEFSKVKRKR